MDNLLIFYSPYYEKRVVEKHIRNSKTKHFIRIRIATRPWRCPGDPKRSGARTANAAGGLRQIPLRNRGNRILRTTLRAGEKQADGRAGG